MHSPERLLTHNVRELWYTVATESAKENDSNDMYRSSVHISNSHDWSKATVASHSSHCSTVTLCAWRRLPVLAVLFCSVKWCSTLLTMLPSAIIWSFPLICQLFSLRQKNKTKKTVCNVGRVMKSWHFNDLLWTDPICAREQVHMHISAAECFHCFPQLK